MLGNLFKVPNWNLGRTSMEMAINYDHVNEVQTEIRSLDKLF